MSSELEFAYATQCRQLGLPKPESEYKAIDGRRYRWDFAWLTNSGPIKGLLVEIQGGIYMRKSGHNSAAGINRDCDKLNIATENGWVCLQFTKDHIKSGEASLTTKRALTKLGVSG